MASPFLMLPFSDENSPETKRLCLYSLKNNTPYNLNLLENLQDLQCVGSANGWLAFLDENGNPFLLSPFSGDRLDLPPLEKDSNNIVKVVLSSHVVVAMYNLGLDTKIAFCRHDDREWRSLECQSQTYYDVVCCDRTNTLLALGPGPLVESWDFNHTIPKKTMIIQDSCPKTLQLAHETFPTDLHTSQWYLALSPFGQIFMIVRYIGEFVRPDDGEVVYEGDTLTDYAAEPLVCPYKTVGFRVFRHDLGRREWVDVESLNGFAVFLGGNQSVMVSAVENKELKINAIYFTDDYWVRMNEDYSYGGHDLGVYSIGDGRIEPLAGCDHHQKIEPPPFWIMNHNRMYD